MVVVVVVVELMELMELIKVKWRKLEKQRTVEVVLRTTISLISS
ncbi:hypothetical protein [Paenibacillus alginolyticus]|nr:hypothetical protein [Paenibacillus frigoriresistens]